MGMQELRKVTGVNARHHAWPITGTDKCLLLLLADPASIPLPAPPAVWEPHLLALSHPWCHLINSAKTFWAQDPFTLLNIIEDSKELLFMEWHLFQSTEKFKNTYYFKAVITNPWQMNIDDIFMKNNCILEDECIRIWPLFTFLEISLVSAFDEDSWILISVSEFNLLWYYMSCSHWKRPLHVHERIREEKSKWHLHIIIKKILTYGSLEEACRRWTLSSHCPGR